MDRFSRRQSLWQNGAYYVGLAFLVSFLFLNYYDLFSKGLSTPISYGEGDHTPIYLQMKAVIDGDLNPFTGFRSDRLGYPFGADFADYPLMNSTFVILLKLLSILTDQWEVLFNLYWWLTFVLAALSAAFAARALRIRGDVAFAIGVLYAFLPFHMLRLGHIWLASYFLVPLQILVLFWFCRPQSLFFSFALTGTSPVRRRRQLFSLLVVLLSAWTGVYYLYFFALLLIGVTVLFFIETRSLRHFFAASILGFTSLVGLLADLGPTILKIQKQGANNANVSRTYNDTERHALKLVQLYLPVSEHRISSLSEIKKKYDTHAFMVFENSSSSLGFLGASGLTLLVGLLFVRRLKNRFMYIISRLNFISILLAIMGGYNSLLAFLGLQSLRGYNRLSVFIAFFSFLVIGHQATKIMRRAKSLFYIPILFAISVLAFLDQTPAPGRMVPLNASGYHLRKSFYQKLEDTIRGSAVFQLPVVSFIPEITPGQLPHYDHLNGYTFTKQVKWSSGTSLGRFDDAAQFAIQNENARVALLHLSALGFEYVYVTESGYYPNRQKYLANLRKHLGQPILAEPKLGISLYKISNQGDKNPSVWLAKNLPITYQFGERVLLLETGYDLSDVIVRDNGTLFLFNNTLGKINVKLSFVASGQASCVLTQADSKAERCAVNAGLNRMCFQIRSGRNKLKFHYDESSQSQVTMTNLQVTDNPLAAPCGFK